MLLFMCWAKSELFYPCVVDARGRKSCFACMFNFGGAAQGSKACFACMLNFGGAKHASFMCMLICIGVGQLQLVLEMHNLYVHVIDVLFTLGSLQYI